MSSVRMASLKPPPRSPSSTCAPTRQPAKRSVASGCGAMRAMCALASRPGLAASTMKALRPRLPRDAGSLRANTT